MCVKACRTGLEHFFFFLTGSTCGEDRGFTLVRLTREIKYFKPQTEGEKGKQSGSGTMKWSESGLKLTDPLSMTSERQTQYVETNMWLAEVGGKQTL